MNGDVRCDGRGEPAAGRGDPAGRGHALSAVSGGAAPVRDRPYRTVRGVGADTVTVTPRRARCRDCSATQILLPTELVLRRADSTEAIGAALVARARGAGYRSIAASFERPESTVRRWLRAAREPHAQWLYRRGVDYAVLIDRELLVRPAAQQTTLGHALNLLAGAAVRFRECFGRCDSVWSLIGFFAGGRLLAAPRSPLRS